MISLGSKGISVVSVVEWRIRNISVLVNSSCEFCRWTSRKIRSINSFTSDFYHVSLAVIKLVFNSKKCPKIKSQNIIKTLKCIFLQEMRIFFYALQKLNAGYMRKVFLLKSVLGAH